MSPKIDYVVPMVFPDDRMWQQDLNRALGYRENHTNDVRYRSWGTEELLVRCIHKNLPWVRDIVILLARPSQLQPWMNSLPGIRIVFHSQFMPKEVLPTFNSRAIEMYLHRIDGLSERFLYGNDDMFPLAPMQEDDFFYYGLPCLHWTMKSYNPSKAFHMACLNGLNFVAAEFGKHYESEWIHIGHNVVPMIKSTCEMFWERWPKKMQASVTTFRLPRNYNQYIYSWWQILSDQYVDYKPPRGYISTGKDINEIREAIQNASGLLCINDNNEVNDIEQIAATIRNEIRKRL